MKTIELKATKEFIDAAEQEVFLSTPAVIKYIIDNKAGEMKAQGGFDYEETSRILRLYDVIRPHLKQFSINGYKTLIEIPKEFFEKTATIEIEEDDYEVLKKWIQPPFKFWLPAKFIVDFVNSFK